MKKDKFFILIAVVSILLTSCITLEDYSTHYMDVGIYNFSGKTLTPEVHKISTGNRKLDVSRIKPIDSVDDVSNSKASVLTVSWVPKKYTKDIDSFVERIKFGISFTDEQGNTVIDNILSDYGVEIDRNYNVKVVLLPAKLPEEITFEEYEKAGVPEDFNETFYKFYNQNYTERLYTLSSSFPYYNEPAVKQYQYLKDFEELVKDYFDLYKKERIIYLQKTETFGK